MLIFRPILKTIKPHHLTHQVFVTIKADYVTTSILMSYDLPLALV